MTKYERIDGTGARLWVELYGSEDIWFVNLYQTSVTKNGPGKRLTCLCSDLFPTERAAIETFFAGMQLVEHFAAN